jgi:hypothetical protein
MKNFYCAFFILFPAFAFCGETPQDTSHSEKEKYRNEFGLDMIYFLNIFRNQYEQANENTMVFAFDRHLSHEHIVRFFLSTGYVKYTTKPDTGAAQHNVQTDLIALPGFGWEKHIGKRWAYFYGLQAKIENAMGKDVRGDNRYGGIQTTYFSNWFYGPSAFSGVKLLVNERISFQLEMDVSFVFYSNVSGFTNEKFPAQNYSTSITGFSTEYIIPKTILLNFKF